MSFCIKSRENHSIFFVKNDKLYEEKVKYTQTVLLDEGPFTIRFCHPLVFTIKKYIQSKIRMQLNGAALQIDKARQQIVDLNQKKYKIVDFSTWLGSTSLWFVLVQNHFHLTRRKSTKRVSS